MTLEQEIYTFAEKRNLEAGITSAEPFWEQEKILLQENGKLKGFTEQNIQKRIIPTMTMENAKSIIVFAMAYGYRKKIKQNKISLVRLQSRSTSKKLSGEFSKD